jgi:hypothetical protein
LFALANTLLGDVPIVPLPDVRLIVPVVTVPVPLIVPLPLAFTVTVPALLLPVDTLPLIATLPLLPLDVSNVTLPPVPVVMLLDIVTPVPVNDTVDPVVPTNVSFVFVLIAPALLTVNAVTLLNEPTVKLVVPLFRLTLLVAPLPPVTFTAPTALAVPPAVAIPTVTVLLVVLLEVTLRLPAVTVPAVPSLMAYAVPLS